MIVLCVIVIITVIARYIYHWLATITITITINPRPRTLAGWQHAVYILLSEAAFVNWKIRDTRITDLQRLAQEKAAERATTTTGTAT